MIKVHPTIRFGRVLMLSALALASSPALAGPPFMTDDPIPVDYKSSEFYIFSTYDKASDGRETAAPAIEYNYGFHRDMMVHFVVPYVHSSPDGAPSESGVGDVEMGIKWLLVHESDSMPAIGIFPLAEFPTGDSGKGLGNGKTWWRLPVWLQKSWGDWTSYGGAGYVINRAEGQKNYPFAGWLLQKDIGEKWTLGGEIFGQGKDTPDARATTFLNVGGYYKFTPDFNLLFSAGHSISGDRHTVAYLGLWWAWGGEESATEKTGAAPTPSAWSLSQR
jgi:hypothetical protein